MADDATLKVALTLRDAFSRPMRGAGAVVSQFRSGIAGATGAIFNLRNAFAGIAVAAVVRKITNVFGGFEKELNRVRVLTGANTEQMELLSDQARELGATTVFSAGQAAEAMAFLGQAGFETEEVFAALPGTLELAAAANLDLGQSADIVTNVLTGMNLGVDQLGRANDTLVGTMTSTNTNLGQLGEAFKFVGPVAAAAGLNFEETSAALGLLGNAGLQGTLAGTSLRGAITKLLVPTAEAEEVLGRLGVNALDSSGELISLTEIIRQLENAGASAADLMTIFGQRAGPGVAALVSQGADELEKLTNNLQNRTVKAADVAAVQMEGLAGSVVKMKSAIEGAVITLGENFAPAIAFGAELISELSSNLSEGVQVFSELSGGMREVGDVGFGEFLRSLIPSVETVIVTLAQMRAGFAALRAVFFSIKAVVLDVFATLTESVGTVVAVVETGIDNAELIFDNFGAFADLTLAIINEKVRDVLDFLLETLEKGDPIFQKLGASTNFLKDSIGALRTEVAKNAVELRTEAEASEAVVKVQGEFNEAVKESKQIAEDNRAAAAQATIDANQAQADTVAAQNEISAIQARFKARKNDEEEAAAAELEGKNQEATDTLQEQTDTELQIVEDGEKAKRKVRKITLEEGLALSKATFGAFAAVAQEGGFKAFGIGKAFAVAQATVSGIQAVQAALASPPGPPFTIPLAAAVGVLQARNVQKIIQTRPGSGGGGAAGGGGGLSAGAGGGGAAPGGGAAIGGAGGVGGIPVGAGDTAVRSGPTVILQLNDATVLGGNLPSLARDLVDLVQEGLDAKA